MFNRSTSKTEFRNSLKKKYCNFSIAIHLYYVSSRSLHLFIFSFFNFFPLFLSFFLSFIYTHTSASRVTIDSIELFEGSAELPRSCCMRIIKDPWPGWCVEECKVTKERPRYAYNTFTCTRSTLFVRYNSRCICAFQRDVSFFSIFFFSV